MYPIGGLINFNYLEVKTTIELNTGNGSFYIEIGSFRQRVTGRGQEFGYLVCSWQEVLVLGVFI